MIAGHDVTRQAALRGAMLIAVLASETTVFGWEARLPRAGRASEVASSPDGGVFAVVPGTGRPVDLTVGVAKLSSRGRELWRRSLSVRAAEHHDNVYALVTTEGGDVLAAGGVGRGRAVEFSVARLAGRTGRPRWSRIVRGSPRAGSIHEGLSLALDPAGDVIAGGEIEGVPKGPYQWTSDLAVVKLAGDSGVERWRYVLDGTRHDDDWAEFVAVDARGDVIVAGTVTDHDLLSADHTPNGSILKLAGRDGRLLWRTPVTTFLDLSAMALDATGAVVVTGTYDVGDGGRFGVLQLDGASGAPRWTATIGEPGSWASALAVTVTPSGDVAAVGFSGGAPNSALAVATFDGATGAERWRRLVTGSDGFGVGSGIAVGPSGNIVVGGRLRNAVSCYDITIMELAATTGDVIATHTFDGTTTATLCDIPEGEACKQQRCPFTGHGIDQDTLTDLTVDGGGRIDATGVLSDGRRGRFRGFVTQLAPAP